MIATNAAISLGLSVIAQFAAICDLPDADVPRSLSDVKRSVIGSPSSAGHLFIVNQNETKYWIKDGAMNHFERKDCYRGAQNIGDVLRLIGEPRLNADEALAVASNVIHRLHSSAPFPSEAQFELTQPRSYKGQIIPFATVKVSLPNGGDTLAEAEVDRRLGKISYLRLDSTGFHNKTIAAELSSLVPLVNFFKKTESHTRTNSHPPPLRPSQEEINIIFKNARHMAARLGIDFSAAELDKVDWSRSGISTGSLFYPKERIASFWLQTGHSISARQGRIFGLGASNAYMRGNFQSLSKKERKRYEGPIQYDWKILASNFQSLLIKEFGFRHSFFRKHKPVPTYQIDPVGTKGHAVHQFVWYDVSNSHKDPALAHLNAAWFVEFDLRTGAPVSFQILSKDVLKYFERAQLKLPSTNSTLIPNPNPSRSRHPSPSP